MLDLKALAALQTLKQTIKEDTPVYRGTVRASGNRHGFVDVNKEQSYYLPAEQMDRVLPGDQIEFSLVEDKDGRQSAEIEQLLSKGVDELFGRVQSKHQQLWLEPDLRGYQRWLLIGKKIPDLAEGQLIKAQLKKHPFDNKQARVDALAIVGTEEQSHVVQHYLASREGLSQTQPLCDRERFQAKLDRLLSERTDLTALPLVTIDGASTKDMDDAICVRRQGEGYRVWVAIADPFSLIDGNDELQQHALHIGHSLYLPGFTVNMLPDALSHDLCSLKANEDRLALVFELTLSATGALEHLAIQAGKIRSRARLNYDQVSQFMAGETELSELDSDCLASLALAGPLTLALQQQRQQQALVGLERPDYELKLDDQGVVMDVVVAERNQSQKFIEELMLLTNHAAAGWLAERQTGIFTTNAGLRTEKINEIEQLLTLHWAGVSLAGQSLSDLSGFTTLVRAVSQLDQGVHNQMLLNRMMSRTLYSDQRSAHFPLGFDGYSTVTSPIRKYNDLLNHQLIHQCLADQPRLAISEDLLDQLNFAMQRARKLEQEATLWLLFDWLKGQNKPLAATLVGVNPSGMQLQLTDCGVRVFVMLKQLKQLQVDNLHQSFSFQEQRYVLGDQLSVRLKQFDEGRKSILAEWVMN